jgi:sodium-dependent phosphate cotransporter
MVSFNLFDKRLQQRALKENHWEQRPVLACRPGPMFFLGAVLTMVSTSVSVSTGFLMPLNRKGYIRKENLDAHIMGANMPTFIDTLLAAILLSNPSTIAIVLVEIRGTAAISFFVLATFYKRYEGAMLSFVAWVKADNRNLAGFINLLVIMPMLLMAS